jgi:CTP synthase
LEKFVQAIKNPKDEVNIAICGKYTQLHDAYKSIIESFNHAGAENNTRVNIVWIESEDLANDGEAVSRLKNVDGILVPGGFGERGVKGKINAIKLLAKMAFRSRYLFGLQCAVLNLP